MTEPIKLPPADVALLIAWHEDMAAEENLNEATRDKHRGSAGELRRLHGEVERLRADAERYRWLRECARATSEHWGGRWSLVTEGPAPETATSAGIDAAIDAARAALAKEKA
jgi:hypothetical protein